MRVLIVSVVHDPEDARIRHRQIGALRAAGHEVVLAAPFTGYSRPLPTDIEGIDLPRAQGRRRFRALSACRRILRDQAPRADVILLHDPELLGAVATVPGLDRSRVVWDVHEDTAAALAMKSWLPGAVKPVVGRAVRAAEGWADRMVRLLLAEESYADRFPRQHPVIPNSTFVPVGEPPPPGDDRVVYVGALTEARGAFEMAELGRALAPLGVAVHLVGPAGGRVAARLQSAHEAGEIVWHGFVPNDRALKLVEGALAGLSLLHDQPNYARARPTKIMEYIARGVPVVSTPNPVSAELLDQHGCGLVVPFGDVRAAADAVRKLRDEPGLRRSMAAAGRRAALEQYNWAIDGQRFVAILEGWAARTPDGDAAAVSPQLR